MTALKLVALWWLIGAVWRTWTIISLRRRYGGYATEFATRAVLGRWWLLKTASACFFWPIGMWVTYVRKNYEINADQASRLIAVTQHLSTHCPDCGEPLEDGLHKGVAKKRPPS